MNLLVKKLSKILYFFILFKIMLRHYYDKIKFIIISIENRKHGKPCDYWQ